ncbi:MAG TPA: HPr family phosphocarrier protein [Candidatus Paceibacterota bacterium]|nr:HPr family phosphocarrier protein [Candidatus Paceibacterota bacterium]
MESDRFERINVEKPQLKVEDGYTITEAIVGLNLGLCARPCCLISKESLNYARDIFLEYEGNKVNAKSIMSLLTLGAAVGTKIQIFVEGDDNLAEEMTLKLYSGLTTKADIYPCFYRFKK